MHRRWWDKAVQTGFQGGNPGLDCKGGLRAVLRKKWVEDVHTQGHSKSREREGVVPRKLPRGQ